MKYHRVALIVIAAITFATEGVADPPKVRVGSLLVPANCALARQEHPRLFFTRADLPEMRRRLELPGLKADFELLKKTVDEGLARKSDRVRNALVPLGILYHLTGNPAYGQACKEATLRAPFGHYAANGAYGYDLVYDLMTPAERRQCETKMLEFVRLPYRESARFIQALALWGSGLEDDRVAQTLSELHGWCRSRLAYLNEWSGDRGGDSNSHAYVGQHEYVGTMGALQAWRSATGESWLPGFDWARTIAPYYIYHYLPGQGGNTVHTGINCADSRAYPEETGARNFTSLAQAEWRCGLTSWWVKAVVMDSRADYTILESYWGPLLWFDPTVAQIRPEQFPEDRLFPGRGYVCMRNDWGSDAVFAHFHCGRFESDGRNNADNNSFIIYHRGYLACDTGTRLFNNPELADMSDGRHHERYFSQTIAHNSITVGAEDVAGNGWTAVAGGQVSRPAREWLSQWGLPATEQTLYEPQAGQIVAYETHPAFLYVAGDASRSYSPKLVRSFTRQFVYLRPGTFVVYDRVVAADSTKPKRWYLHTMEEPRSVDGSEKPDLSVHATGHALLQGRSVRATHRGGALFSQTVLPAACVIRKIGGSGHQFEVNGENYDMFPAWYQQIERVQGFRQFAEGIGLGGWRLEVEPAQAAVADEFLHVLTATDAGVPSVPQAEKIERENRVGVRITVGDKSYELLFNRTGPVGGHIKRTGGAGVELDRELTDRVEDHYRQWQSDPRYVRWTTDPAMRSVIGERG